MKAERAFQTPLVCVQCLKTSLGDRLSPHRLWAVWSEAAGCRQPADTALPLAESKEHLDISKI